MGAADPDEAFVAIKELPDVNSTLDCTKYAGYVVTVGGQDTAPTANVTLTNLTPGAIIHIVCLGINAFFLTTGDVKIRGANNSLTQSFQISDSTNSLIATLIVVSDTRVAIGKLT